MRLSFELKKRAFWTCERNVRAAKKWAPADFTAGALFHALKPGSPAG
jgi:hypothetical protein